jgi:ketosteroid isomerase-like protein
MEDDMTLTEIANELVAGCREGRETANLDKLYAPDAVSVEAADMGGGTTVTGVAAIKGKHDWWAAAHEIHHVGVEGPFTHGDGAFAVVFDIDVTNRDSGQRITAKEVGVYHVKDAKIVREEFFYSV